MVVEFCVSRLANYNAIRQGQSEYFLPAIDLAVMAMDGQTPYNAENADWSVALVRISSNTLAEFPERDGFYLGQAVRVELADGSS